MMEALIIDFEKALRTAVIDQRDSLIYIHRLIAIKLASFNETDGE